MFTQDSLFSSNELPEGPAFLAKHLQRSLMELSVISNFHQRRPHRGDRTWDLATRPRIHIEFPAMHCGIGRDVKQKKISQEQLICRKSNKAISLDSLH